MRVPDRWTLLRAARRQLARSWRATVGWRRGLVVVGLLVLVAVAGLVGVAVTVVVALVAATLWALGAVGQAVQHLRTRSARRYLDAIDATQQELLERDWMVRRELAARERHIDQLHAERRGPHDGT